MGLFKKKTIVKTYDKDNQKPVIKASICNNTIIIIISVRPNTILNRQFINRFIFCSQCML